MRTGRFFGVTIPILLMAALGQSDARGAEVESAHLEVGPPSKLVVNLLFAPEDQEIRLQVRALRVSRDESVEPSAIQARGADHRDETGAYRVELVVPRGGEARQELAIPIDPDEFDLPEGIWEVGLTILGLQGEDVVFVAATPLAQVEVGPAPDHPAKFLGVETVPNIFPDAPIPAPDEVVPPMVTLPPDLALLRPSPQAPGKSLPLPVPSKMLPAPQAPAMVMGAGQALGTREDMGLLQATVAAQIQPIDPRSPSVKRLIYFATNRNPIPNTEGEGLNDRFGSDFSPGNSLTFGSCLVNVPIWIDGKKRPNGDLPLPSLGNLYRRTDKVFYVNPPVMLDWELVRTALARVGPAGENDILVFVHGFNNQMEGAILRLAQVAQDTGFLGRAILYSWPSDGSLLLSMNSFRSFPEGSYNRDGRMAASSGEPLADLIRRLDRIQAAKSVGEGQATPRVHVIAHSMGNRVLLDAMTSLAADPIEGGRKPLGHVVLAAPDVATNHFEDQIPAAYQVSDDVTLYFNPADWALLSSHYLFTRVPRAGEDGAFGGPAPQLDRVDARKASTTILGHDYAMSGNLLLADLQQLLHDGLRASKRTKTLKDRIYRPGDLPYWLFP
ncbi:alpha/beta hydrolase [Tundrisphaera lichenicola]|uniref:alpha/beta hydrolase n=1 Tax=Tundrisphaera lichenicola TaxID=2029860 RepID=UPI003EBC2216